MSDLGANPLWQLSSYIRHWTRSRMVVGVCLASCGAAIASLAALQKRRGQAALCDALSVSVNSGSAAAAREPNNVVAPASTVARKHVEEAGTFDDQSLPGGANSECFFTSALCPWHDCLSHFLHVSDLLKLCRTSTGIRNELTIELDCAEQRKLILPVVELQIETAEDVVNRISMGHVRILRIWHRLSFDAIASIVTRDGPQALKSLERMAFKGCPLYSTDIRMVLQPVFASARGLKHLNLEKNQVTDTLLQELVSSEALLAASLESLNLRFNRIGPKGAVALASCKSCASMKWINLKMNQIGDEGALAFATMLHGNSSMTLLNLRRQVPALSDKTAFGFADALRSNVTLEQLRLRRNRIGDKGASAIAEALSERLGRQCAIDRFATPRFELDLEENKVGERGAFALLSALHTAPGNNRLEMLIHGNPTDRGALCRLAGEATGLALNAGDSRLSFETKAEGIL